jgi:hypothetical protein
MKRSTSRRASAAGEGFVERGGLVGVEIVLHQHDLRCVGKMHVRQIPERMGIIDGGVVVVHRLRRARRSNGCGDRRWPMPTRRATGASTPGVRSAAGCPGDKALCRRKPGLGVDQHGWVLSPPQFATGRQPRVYEPPPFPVAHVALNPRAPAAAAVSNTLGLCPSFILVESEMFRSICDIDNDSKFIM